MATLPGVFAPAFATVALALGVPERNFFVASAGSQAFLSTPSVDSITLRAAAVLLTALTVCTTMGMPAIWPCTSVEANSFSPKPTSPFLNLMALARNIVCGKSRLNSWGGT